MDALRALRTRSRALVAAAGGATAPTTATAPLDGGTPGDGWARALTRSFPLPRGVVSMHVRHGDKGVEMPLVPAVDYMWAAESRLVALNPLSLVRGAFVSTEDPGVLDDAVAVTRGAFEGLPPGNPLARWGFVWSDIPRHNACVQRVWGWEGEAWGWAPPLLAASALILRARPLTHAVLSPYAAAARSSFR